MKFKNLGLVSLSLLLFLGLYSCGTKTTEESTDSSQEFEQADADLKEQIQDVIYDIPSPSEIPFLLETTGAEYNEALINDNNKADQYANGNDNTSLNLGVYATDVGYLVSYDKVQEALNYMGSAKKLADNIGVSGSFDTELLKRFEDNLSSKDSLASLLNETLNKTDVYLKNDQRNKLSALILAGSFIEGLYISTGLVSTYPKDILPEDKRNIVLTPLMSVILKQEKSLDDLILLLESTEQSEAVTNMVSELKALSQSYKELNIDEQIENKRADLVLSDQTLIDITTKVASIRQSIVE